jgi:NADH-quinone oxidoreductase subunit M
MAVFFGAFKSDLADAKLYTILGTLGIVMGAVYILVMIQKVFLGKEREKPEHELHDLGMISSIYGWALMPLAAFTILLGVWPAPAVKVVDKQLEAWLVPLHEHSRNVDHGALPDVPKLPGATEEK